MLLLKSIREHQDRSDDAPKLSPTFTFITRRGLTPEHSHTKTTPWSVFQDGSLMTITPASLQSANLSPPQGITQWAITLPKEPHSRSLYPPERTDAGLNRQSAPAENARMINRPKSGHKRFPFNNFTYFLTLFSKCFSSFDHSTCALSVSGRYLALEDVYLPFRAAFPNYSTRRRSFHRGLASNRRGSHPLWRPVPGNSEGTVARKHPLQITTRA